MTGRKINYTTLPHRMQGAMQRWVENGILPGDFPTAVLCNDFMGAFGKADITNLAQMEAYARFLYNEAPQGCYGSPETVKEWISSGGMNKETNNEDVHMDDSTPVIRS